MDQSAENVKAVAASSRPSFPRWHPNYALALAIAFAAGVAAFAISPEAGRFATWVFAYIGIMGVLIAATVVFAVAAQGGSWFASLLTLVCGLGAIWAGVGFPMAAFSYVTTGSFHA